MPTVLQSQGYKSACCISFRRMEPDATAAKQTHQVEDQSQAPVAEKSEKAQLKRGDAKKLIQFMENNYDKYVARAETFDDLYHALFELIAKFCEERGQLQYRIPEKKILRDAYDKHHKVPGELRKDEFMKISKEVIRLDSFTFGKATTEFLMFLFGAPACALLAKRILPGLGWLSDDIVIPLATSGSVVYLAHTKKL